MRLWSAAMAIGVALCPWTFARADNFAGVRYDPGTDALLITMAYRGTNGDHEFKLDWGECKHMESADGAEIVADVLDSQAQDAARGDYKKTFRVSLAKLACRPARLTLRTAPRFYTSLSIPAIPNRVK